MAASMPQQVVRSSSRIPKEIPILLIGSDLDGKVFSEPTNTVLLSLHGAGIVSHHKLSPEQELILRCPDRNIEAEIRVVGQLGSQQGIYTYGVAFVDPILKFWDIDFPPMSPAEMERGLLSLVCNSCKTLEKIDDTGIEADIFATGDGVLRFCKRCGTTTFWKPAQPYPLPAVNPESLPSAADAQMPLFPGAAPPAPPASFPPPALSPPPAPAAPPAASALPPALAVSLPPAPVPAAPQPSFYASARPLPQTAVPSQSSVGPAGSELVVERLGAVATLPPPPGLDTPQVNRRKHPRVKVTNRSSRRLGRLQHPVGQDSRARPHLCSERRNAADFAASASLLQPAPPAGKITGRKTWLDSRRATSRSDLGQNGIHSCRRLRSR
jgi:hypothetical protein